MTQIIMPGQVHQRIDLVDRYSLTGDLQTVAIEDVGDKRVFHYAQQTGNITNLNEQRRKDNPDWNRKSEFRQVASVPMIVWNLWESMGITLDQKALRRELNRYRNEYMTVEKTL
jgi:hypothetical protein